MYFHVYLSFCTRFYFPSFSLEGGIENEPIVTYRTNHPSTLVLTFPQHSAFPHTESRRCFFLPTYWNVNDFRTITP